MARELGFGFCQRVRYLQWSYFAIQIITCYRLSLKRNIRKNFHTQLNPYDMGQLWQYALSMCQHIISYFAIFILPHCQATRFYRKERKVSSSWIYGPSNKPNKLVLAFNESSRLIIPVLGFKNVAIKRQQASGKCSIIVQTTVSFPRRNWSSIRSLPKWGCQLSLVKYNDNAPSQIGTWPSTGLWRCRWSYIILSFILFGVLIVWSTPIRQLSSRWSIKFGGMLLLCF